jgi:hypothetical protein
MAHKFKKKVPGVEGPSLDEGPVIGSKYTKSRKKKKQPTKVVAGPVVAEDTCNLALVHWTVMLKQVVAEAQNVRDVAVGTSQREKMSQELLLRMARMQAAQKLLSAAFKKIDAELLAHCVPQGGAGFETGAVSVVYGTSGKRSPKWKDEAVGMAAKVAKSLGVPFEADVYIAKVVEGTTPSDAKKASLVLTE